MENLLIIGCGDIARRAIPLLSGHFRLYALVRDAARLPGLRAMGVTPVMGDLDKRRSLRRLAGLAQAVLHLAPPDGQGEQDRRHAICSPRWGRAHYPNAWCISAPAACMAIAPATGWTRRAR